MTESKIEWTGDTWEVTAGCSRVSSGCENCYAEKLVGTRFYGMAKRREHDGVANGSPLDLSLNVINPKTKKWNGHIELLEMNIDHPLKKKKPTVYFVNSRSDLFHEKVPFEYIDKVFAVMALCPRHRFQVLTKRPERMAEYLTKTRPIQLLDGDPFDEISTNEFVSGEITEITGGEDRGIHGRLLREGWPLPNVWLGTSVEDQDAADKRIPQLLACPAIGRFISAEPLIGQVFLEIPYGCRSCNHSGPQVFARQGCRQCGGTGDEPSIGGVIAGGESGPFDDVRMCRLEWFRSIKDQCEGAGVPFFMKQMGVKCHDFSDDHAPCLETKIGTGKGGDPSEWPEDMRVRQVPEGLRIEQ